MHTELDLKKARMRVAATRTAAPINSHWRHKNRGSRYWVQAVGIREEDGEPLVIYRDSKVGTCWVRPASEFLDGRFERVLE